MILGTAGFTSLMSAFAIKAREEIVLPLLTIQQFALMKIQEMQQNGQSNSSLKSVYEALITRSLFGNINASRNSA